MSYPSSVIRKVTLTMNTPHEEFGTGFSALSSFVGEFYIDRYEWVISLQARKSDKDMLLRIRIPGTLNKAMELWVQEKGKKYGRIKVALLSTDGYDTPVVEDSTSLLFADLWPFIPTENWSTLLGCVSTTVTSTGTESTYKHEIQMLVTIDWEDFLTYVRATQPSGPLSLYPLLTLLKKPLFSDVTLCVGNRKFNVQKCILAAQSSVFRAMFESEMLESVEGTVNITDISPETMNAILECLYGQEVAAVCSDLSDASEFLMAADKYQLENLLWSGEQLLLRLPTERETSYTALKVFTVGYRLNRPAIMKHGVQLLLRDPRRLERSDSLDEFVKQDLQMVKQMFVLFAEAAADSSKGAAESNS